MADDDRTRFRTVLELSRITRLKGRGDAALLAGLLAAFYAFGAAPGTARLVRSDLGLA